jgi:hypothetical protein
MNSIFTDQITTSILQPNYINEISEFIKGRTRWRTIGLTFETVSKLLMGAGSILSFASGVYSNTNYSFIAGSISTLSVVSLQFATFCYKESKQSTDDLNTLLRKLQLDTIPDLNVSLNDIDDSKQKEKIIQLNKIV